MISTTRTPNRGLRIIAALVASLALLATGASVAQAAPRPSAPTNVSARSTNAQVTVTWTAVSGATSYRVYRDNVLVASPTSTSHTSSGLTNGTRYTFFVTAVNKAGASAASATTSATPVATPAGLSAKAGDSQVTLTWATAAGASRYELLRNGSVIASVSTLTYTNTGLANGTSYSFTVRGVNDTGASAVSWAVTAVPAAASPSATTSTTSPSATTSPKATVPAAPTGLTATPGDRQVALAWTPSSGATSYQVLQDGVQVGAPGSAAYTASGLVNGTAYTFTVKAVNSVGTSTASAPVTSTPTLLTPPPGDVPARLAWFYYPPTSSADEAVVLSDFDTFVLTKTNETFLGKVRAAQPGTRVLQYFLLDQIIDPGTGYEYPNNAAYQPGDFTWIKTNHYDWFLKDQNGNPVVAGGKYWRMDPGNAEWRAFWVQRVKAANTNWDGVFLDNLDLSLVEQEQAGVSIPKYPSDAAYTDALAGFVKYIYDNYRIIVGKPVQANLVNGTSTRDARDKYLPYLDGAMEEAWSVGWSTAYLSASTWSAHLARVDRLTDLGKSVVLVAQGNQSDAARQAFAFASYLLVAAPNVSFRYANYTAYGVPYMYSNYGSKIGTPLGTRYALGDGSVRRDYTLGCVVVNPTTRVAQIIVGTCPAAGTVPGGVGTGGGSSAPGSPALWALALLVAAVLIAGGATARIVRR